MHAKPNNSEVSLALKTIDFKPPWESRLDRPNVVFPVHEKQIVPVLIHHRTPRGPDARFKQSLRGLVHCGSVSRALFRSRSREAAHKARSILCAAFNRLHRGLKT